MAVTTLNKVAINVQRYGDQIRALWVTRWDFYGEEDIAEIMRRTADAGFNTVFFQVGYDYHLSLLSYHFR
jgi:uncharacterized lipoprotein YddW (UPF0748 family)